MSLFRVSFLFRLSADESFHYTADVIADVVLIVAPLKFLWGVNLKRSQKIRLYALFSASIITTVVSIVQDWLVLSAGGLREETASMVEGLSRSCSYPRLHVSI